MGLGQKLSLTMRRYCLYLGMGKMVQLMVVVVWLRIGSTLKT